MNRRLIAWLEGVSAQTVGTVLGGVILAALAKLAGLNALKYVDWTALVPAVLFVVATLVSIARAELKWGQKAEAG